MKEMEAKTENRYEYRKPQEKRKQMIAPDLFEFACFSFLNNLYIKQTKNEFYCDGEYAYPDNLGVEVIFYFPL